jgi:hypothetical protein
MEAFVRSDVGNDDGECDGFPVRRNLRIADPLNFQQGVWIERKFLGEKNAWKKSED